MRRGATIRTSGNPSIGAEPHCDHFDASKFGPNGVPLRAGKPAHIGRKSTLRPDDAEQVLFLERLAKAAAADLAEFLEAKGFKTRCARSTLLGRLHKGWRPKA